KTSRYWLIKKTSKLFASGTRRVEFADFWLGDQFCSLIFPLSNSYLLICAYTNGFDENWHKCGSSTRYWPLAFVLAALPLFIRLVQSIKRYYDSKLVTHLINGGKYASGMLSYFFYYWWRSQGRGRGASFALWCICNTSYAVYASSWDLLMDWSLLRRHARYPLLRQELVYSNQVLYYYFAILSNVLIRFIWVLYIPTQGPSSLLRSFIAAMLEILRRWQWNFYRLENEHLGNVDQYRITREVPLPYSFDVSHDDDIDEDSDDRRVKSLRREKR
ncbi:EXS-domain-containing protein, partial [Pluteus cervinus]